ncbi:MAG: Peptidoglycan-binding LysM [Frankiales bacterium]|nr:Peptidoglycan-binding LysM [Frankiales bacterium]
MPRSARNLGLLVLLAAVLTAGAPSIIRIHSGDTLSGLARKHHTTVSALLRLNHLRSTTIYAGELLRIPGQNVTATRERTVNRVYVVRAGDNLTRLGRRLGHSVAWLKARNGLRTSTIVIGQKVVYGVTTASPVTRASGAVTGSAAHHRAVLRSRTMPSRSHVRGLIRASARRHGVPASLALALSYQESGFQQRVVSPVDAIGVMQVLPSTGRSLGRMHGRSYDLLNVNDNVEAGVTLIADLLRATRSVDKALAGYYQGLGSVGRIGYLPQTRQYIKNITLLRRQFS